MVGVLVLAPIFILLCIRIDEPGLVLAAASISSPVTNLSNEVRLAGKYLQLSGLLCFLPNLRGDLRLGSTSLVLSRMVLAMILR